MQILIIYYLLFSNICIIDTELIYNYVYLHNIMSNQNAFVWNISQGFDIGLILEAFRLISSGFGNRFVLSL